MTNEPAETRLADLAARYWQFECEETPFSAILAGEPVKEDALFRESEADYSRRYSRAAGLLADLAAIPIQNLGGSSLATHRLLRHELSTIRNLYEVSAHLRPSLFPVGPDFNTIYFANTQNLDSVEDATRYLARIATIPAFLRHLEQNLRAGLAAGLRYPRRVLECGIASMKASIAGAPESSPWNGPFRRSLRAQDAAFEAVASRGRALIADEIYPALRAYGDCLEGPIREGARASLACTDSPQGREFYRVLVSQFTTLELSPNEIHAIGLAEVDRIGEQMAAVAATAGFSGDLAGYRRHLATDGTFFADSPDELRRQLEVLCKRIDRKIPNFFGRIPRSTYGVESIPLPASANLPPAYAQPNPADRSSSGVFWVTSLTEKCPSYMHVPLALHEGWPGHLMHIALIQEMDKLPSFRRYGAVKYTACVEGWALYCEGLGKEFGLYQTPDQDYGRLEFEMWRAVRLVLDTGIHWYGWTRERAVDYMLGHLSLPRPTIESEVDRYIALPGQALAYQLGNLRIRGLRELAEARLGAQFSLRAFHDQLTGIGAVTLPILEELMDDWMNRSLGDSAPSAGDPRVY